VPAHGSCGKETAEGRGRRGACAGGGGGPPQGILPLGFIYQGRWWCWGGALCEFRSGPRATGIGNAAGLRAPGCLVTQVDQPCPKRAAAPLLLSCRGRRARGRPPLWGVGPRGAPGLRIAAAGATAPSRSIKCIRLASIQ
jgi:hypothetical protein